MNREHPFLVHFREVLEYEQGMKERLIDTGNGNMFKPGALNFCIEVEPIICRVTQSSSDLEFVHQRASFFLENNDFHAGVMVGVLVQKLDSWLLDKDESYWNRSLWRRFGRKF